MQLRYGWQTTDDALDVLPDLILDGSKMGGFHSSWQLHPVGIINIPSVGFRNYLYSASPSFTMFNIFNYAEKISTAAQLSVDRIYALPADMLLSAEGWDNTNFAHWMQTDDNREIGLFSQYDGFRFTGISNGVFGFDNFRLPLSGGWTAYALGTKDYFVHEFDRLFEAFYVGWYPRYALNRVDPVVVASNARNIKVYDTIYTTESKTVQKIP